MCDPVGSGGACILRRDGLKIPEMPLKPAPRAGCFGKNSLLSPPKRREQAAILCLKPAPYVSPAEPFGISLPARDADQADMSLKEAF